jgi:hypothetical protein
MRSLLEADPGRLIGLPLLLVGMLFNAAGNTPNRPELRRAEGQLGHIRATPDGPLGFLSLERSEDAGKRPEAALVDWRTAILIRDPDMVTKLDAAFLEAPAMYLEALKKSATSDENERVRAFSTRELGKFKRVDLVPSFEQLLNDKSPFVRKNAAWALGELSVGSDALVVARHARAALRNLAIRDPAEDVRLAARRALERIE